jgi:glycosyltransferase involved in cell wall biosynthesis
MAFISKIAGEQIHVINACVPVNFAVKVAKQEENLQTWEWDKERKKALEGVNDPDQMTKTMAAVREKLASKRKKGQLVVGGSGVTQWQKGLEPWLLMASHVAKNFGPNAVKFLWVGMDHTPDTYEVMEKMRMLGLEDVVEFVPQTPDPFPHYAEFDVFAMTSWEDPCPLVVLEAMLLEKPVVCFKNGMGASEEVGDTGIVINSGLPSDMAVAVEALLKDPSRRKEMGVAASKRVIGNFTVNKSARELAGLLREMSAGGMA